MLLLYRMLMPLAFLLFAPGLLVKLVRRPGHKRSYAERFGFFSKEKAASLKARQGAVWLHAVSVGEVNVALSMLSRWMKDNPSRRFVISTTTTTGQELAIKKAPPGVEVFFCPLDFSFAVRRALRLVRPSALVIFETEIWPNLISMAKSDGVRLALVNTRISDKSVGGYVRFKGFFAPLLERFDAICVQTERDRERLLSISKSLNPSVCGNMKFDQAIPESLKLPDLDEVFGKGPRLIILAASTHSPEERLVAQAFLKLKEGNRFLRLVIVPRHAERGKEVASWLDELKIPFHRRSSGKQPASHVDCLLADTTGELLSFIAVSDIVIMGKTLAGNDEGQNVIEPALLGKPIVSGALLRNFRQAMDALVRGDGVIAVKSDDELGPALERLISSPDERLALGARAKEAISAHKGAIGRTLKLLEETL